MSANIIANAPWGPNYTAILITTDNLLTEVNVRADCLPLIADHASSGLLCLASSSGVTGTTLPPVPAKSLLRPSLIQSINE